MVSQYLRCGFASSHCVLTPMSPAMTSMAPVPTVVY